MTRNTIKQFISKSYYRWKNIKTVTVSVLLCTLLALFLYFVPRIFLINLPVHHPSGSSLYYNVGAFVYQKDGQFDQYTTRRKEYTTAYLTSLYEPSIKVGNEIYTIYRPKSQPIKFRNETYYLYIAETTAYLAKSPESIPVYENNMIVGPSIGLFGYGNSIYHYTWQELYDAYVNNKTSISVSCYNFAESNCGDRFEKLGIDVVADTSSSDSYSFTYSYHLKSDLIGRNVQPMASYVIPEDFYLCPTVNFDEYDCIYPKEKEQIWWEDMPVRLLRDDDSFELLSLRDLHLTPFYVTNLKIADYYTVKTSNPYKISPRNEFYFVHKSNSLVLQFSPQDIQNPRADIQLQFGTVRFYDDLCNTDTCTVSIKVQFITK